MTEKRPLNNIKFAIVFTLPITNPSQSDYSPINTTELWCKDFLNITDFWKVIVTHTHTHRTELRKTTGGK